MTLNTKFTHPPYPSHACPNCGGTVSGDGYHTVIHCDYAEEEDIDDAEAPDDNPVWCRVTAE